MHCLRFDTLDFANRLKASGVDATLAEAHAQALGSALDAYFSDVATRADLRELEARMTAAMRELELRLTIRLGAMLVVAVGALAALQRLGP